MRSITASGVGDNMAAALNDLCEAMSDTAIALPAPPPPCPLLRLSDDVLEVVGHQIVGACWNTSASATSAIPLTIAA